MNLNRSKAAEYLGLKTKTLDNWRSAGRGPRYLKLGARVLYPQTELDAFKAANLRQSTSERGAAA
jgi:predicted DNA-binding transcriptional regulator AlpA